MKAASVLLDSDLLIDAVIKLFEGREPEEAEVTAACSALSYAAVREDQKGNTEKATELRKLLSDRGIVVQSVLNGYTMNMYGTELSPAGDLCAVQSMFSGLNKSTSYCIMASRTLRPLTMIDCPAADQVECVRFAPDSRHLAIKTYGTVTVWDLSELRILYSFNNSKKSPGSCSWSADSRRLSFFFGRTVHVLDIGERTADEVLCIDAGVQPHRICLNDDGSRVMTVSERTYSVMDIDGSTLVSDVALEGGRIANVFCKDGFHVITRCCMHTIDDDGDLVKTISLNADVSGLSVDGHEESFEILEEYQKIIGRVEDGKMTVYVPEGSGYMRNTVDADLDLKTEYVTDAPADDPMKGLPQDVKDRILNGNPYTLDHSGSRLCMRTADGFACVENVYSGRGCSRTECSMVNVPTHSDRYVGCFLKPEAAEVMFAERAGDAVEVRECEPGFADVVQYVNAGSRFDSYLMHDDTDMDRSPWEVYEIIDIDALVDSEEWILLKDSGTYAVHAEVCGMPAVVTFDGDLDIRMFDHGYTHLHSGPEGMFFHDRKRVYMYDADDGTLKAAFGFEALPETVRDGDRPVTRIFGYDRGYAVMCGITSVRHRVVFMNGDEAVHQLSTDAPDAFRILGSKAYWVSNRTLHVLDLDGFRKAADICIRTERDWKVAGISSDGTVSLVRFADPKNVRHRNLDATLEFGMMRGPDYRFERFMGVRQPVSEIGLSGISVCRNDVVFIDRNHNRDVRLNYGHLGRDGMSNTHTLIPDTGRADAKVFSVPDDRYLMVSAAKDRDGGDRRMVMRLMDAAEGVPISYNLKGTKGQMYGKYGYSIDHDCRIFVSDDFTHLIAESVCSDRFHINSWDIMTGKRYPEDGADCGNRLMDYGDGELRTAVEDGNGHVREAEVRDKMLNILRTERLDVILTSDDQLLNPEADGSRVPLNGYTYKGEMPDHLCIPANMVGDFRDRAYESIPVIIPLGVPVPVSPEGYPRPACYRLYPDVPSFVSQRCLLAQLRCGMISHEQETELVLAVDGSSEPSDAVCGSISENMFLYVRNGGYLMGQIMSDKGQMFDPEFTCTLTDMTDGTVIDRIVCRDSKDGTRPLAFDGDLMMWISDEVDGMVFRGSDGTEVPLGMKDPETNPEPILKTGDKVLVRTGPDTLLFTDGETSLSIDDAHYRDIGLAEDRTPGSIILVARHTRFSAIRIQVEEDLSGYRMDHWLYAPVTTEFDIGSWIVRNRNGIYTAEKKGF